jgi:hypothetical protein
MRMALSVPLEAVGSVLEGVYPPKRQLQPSTVVE